MAKKRKTKDQTIEVIELSNDAVKKISISDLKEIKPLTKTQELAFQKFDENFNLWMTGFAGTGKTFIALYLALRAILTEPNKYQRLIIVRSAVPTKEIGYLPGTLEEKIEQYEMPYYPMCQELFRKLHNPYDLLKEHGIITFMSTSFVRGITLNNAIIIFDECQNANFHELDSVITRLGHNAKVIFCGDFMQSDLTNKYDKSGFHDFTKIINDMPKFFYGIEYQPEDIVRGPLVKDYILTKHRLGIGI